MKDALQLASPAIGAVASVSAVVSVSGGQLGVANAMMRLASCDEDDEAEEDNSDVPVLVHPLRFSFGGWGATGAYAAAAVGNTIIIPSAVALVARFPLRLFLVRVRGNSARQALVSIGFPAVVMTPFLTLAEGTAVSVVRALRSGTPQGIAFGLMGFAATAVFVAAWLRVLILILPRRRLNLAVNPDGAEGEQHREGCGKRLLRLFAPTRTWVPAETEEEDESRQQATLLTGDDGGAGGQEMAAVDVVTNSRSLLDPEAEAAEACRRRRRLKFLSENCERFEKTLGDKQLFYAEIASFGCSLLVGVCEGVPSTFCVERAAVAVIATTAQAVLECLTLVPAERLLQLVMAAMVIPMSIAVLAMAVIGAEGAPSALEAAIEVLTLLINAVGLVLLAVGIGSSALGVLMNCSTEELPDDEASALSSPLIGQVGFDLFSEDDQSRSDRLSADSYDFRSDNTGVPAKSGLDGEATDHPGFDLSTSTEEEFAAGVPHPGSGTGSLASGTRIVPTGIDEEASGAGIGVALGDVDLDFDLNGKDGRISVQPATVGGRGASCGATIGGAFGEKDL